MIATLPYSISSRSYASVISSMATASLRACSGPVKSRTIPCPQQLPRHHDVGVVLVLEGERHGPVRGLIAVSDLGDPPEQVQRADDPPPQRDVAHPGQSGELQNVVLLVVPIAVLDDRDLHPQPAAFLEAGVGALRLPRTEIDHEVEARVRAVTQYRHRSPPPDARP